MVYVYTNISLPYGTCNLFVLRNDSTSRLTGHTIASALQFPSADQFGRSVFKGGFDLFSIRCITCLCTGKLINMVATSEVNG